MLPIARILGSLFTILGIFLFLYGLFTDGNSMYDKTFSFNINLYWGIIMIGFGLVFVVFGRKNGFLNQ
ncbi:MAG: hypothetical protein MH321_02535 [Leptospiraceae bacterium]|nr:hypothetical protein [Leptospiraceae bacterium]